MKRSTTLIILLLLLSSLSITAQTAQPFDVKISGSGSQAIILIPGFASSGDVWTETRKNLEPNYTCYTLTMAGFAGVPAQPGSTFASWEKAIASYIQQNHIQKPIVIGHSMGGGLALALAADYPELLSKIIVVDALPCLAALMNPSFKTVDKPDCSPMLSKMMEMNEEQFRTMQQRSIPQLLADTGHQAQVVDWSVRSDRKTFAEMYCDFSNTDLRTRIATVRCPALILLEAYFINFKPAIDEQYKNLKTGQFQYATKGLHFIMYDDKAWYDQQLTNFLHH